MFGEGGGGGGAKAISHVYSVAGGWGNNMTPGRYRNSRPQLVQLTEKHNTILWVLTLVLSIYTYNSIFKVNSLLGKKIKYGMYKKTIGFFLLTVCIDGF